MHDLYSNHSHLQTVFLNLASEINRTLDMAQAQRVCKIQWVLCQEDWMCPNQGVISYQENVCSSGIITLLQRQNAFRYYYYHHYYCNDLMCLN
jgi:hypothetical protein